MSAKSQILLALERMRSASEASGWEVNDAKVRAELAAVEREHRDERLRRAGASLAPAEWMGVVTGTLDHSATVAGRCVAAWGSDRMASPVLVLSGPTGVGKSVAGAWWIAHRGGLVRSAAAASTAWDSSTVRSQDVRELLSDVSRLVLDDVGTEPDRYAEAMGAALRELLEVRQSKRTIITTNLSKRLWAQRYPDARLISRMRRADWQECGGDDLRRGK